MITVVAAVGIGATRAYFFASKPISENTFATGTVTLGDSVGLPISVTNLAPGVTTGVYGIGIPYTGTLQADLYIGVGGTSTPGQAAYIADHLVAKIVDQDSNIVFWDYVSNLSTNWRKIATNIGNGTRYYYITFKMDINTPNEHQGVSNTDTIIKLYAVQTGQPAPSEMPYLYNVTAP